MQRREFFRLVLPMTQRPTCFLKNIGEGQQITEFSTVDIGIGGVGLEVAKLDFPCDVGMHFPEARIELKGIGELKLELEIRYAGEITKGTRQVQRLGCLFTKLSSSQENLVQKFMSQIQREERAKLGR
jgi:c-di-GMP-binding flagellar brake protein YcgR